MMRYHALLKFRDLSPQIRTSIALKFVNDPRKSVRIGAAQLVIDLDENTLGANDNMNLIASRNELETMLFSNAAGFDALTGSHNLKIISRFAFGFLMLGGMILGPVVQKYAFDAYWTGWPFGSDWTDNKLAIGALVWAIAMWRTWKSDSSNKAGRWEAVFAMLVIFVVYSIPHSIHGSTLDYETGEHIQVMMRTIESVLG